MHVTQEVGWFLINELRAEDLVFYSDGALKVQKVTLESSDLNSVLVPRLRFELQQLIQIHDQPSAVNVQSLSLRSGLHQNLHDVVQLVQVHQTGLEAPR